MDIHGSERVGWGVGGGFGGEQFYFLLVISHYALFGGGMLGGNLGELWIPSKMFSTSSDDLVGVFLHCAELRSFRRDWMALRWHKINIWQKSRTTEHCCLALYPGSHDANSSLFVLSRSLRKR